MNKVLHPYVSFMNKDAEGCVAEIDGQLVYIHKVTNLKYNVLIVYTVANRPPVWKFKRINMVQPCMFFKSA